MRALIRAIVVLLTLQTNFLFSSAIIRVREKPLIFKMLSAKKRARIRKLSEKQEVVKWSHKAFTLESSEEVEKMKRRGWVAYVITTTSIKEHIIGHPLLYIERYLDNGCLEFIATDFIPNVGKHFSTEEVSQIITSDLSLEPMPGKIRHSSGKEKVLGKSGSNNVFFQLTRDSRDWDFHSIEISNEQFQNIQEFIDEHILNPPLFAFNPRDSEFLNCEQWIISILDHIGLKGIEHVYGLNKLLSLTYEANRVGAGTFLRERAHERDCPFCGGFYAGSIKKR